MGECRKLLLQQTQRLFCNLDLQHNGTTIEGLMARWGLTIGRFIICLFFFFPSLSEEYRIQSGVARRHCDGCIYHTPGKQWRPLWSIMSHSPLTARLRRSGVTAAQMETETRMEEGVCAQVCVYVCGCELFAWHRAALCCQVVIFLRAAHNGLLSLLRQHCNSSAPWLCVKAVAASASEGRISSEKKFAYQRFQIYNCML